MSAFRRAGRRACERLAARAPDGRTDATGRTGAGGDATLIIDAEAEDVVVEELERLARIGCRFSAISEERGYLRFGADFPLVVVDPIDGSLNAKRGFGHHTLSIALADGPTVEDVRLGYVFDFGAAEEWWAVRGSGAFLDGEPVVGPAREVRSTDGRLELLAVETNDARWYAATAPELARRAFRLRVLGSIAAALCQVAAGRVDAMVNLNRCRAVDAAAAVLVVRESGGLVGFPHIPGGLAAPLDLQARSSVVAARSAAGVEELTPAASNDR